MWTTYGALLYDHFKIEMITDLIKERLENNKEIFKNQNEKFQINIFKWIT